LILRLFGSKVGQGVVIKPGVNIKYPWKLKVGNFVWIGENVWIDNLDFVNIMDNSCISQGAMLLCGNHNYSSTSFDLIINPITIETGVWIGAKCVLCPGVKAGSHSVLSAGSVASKDLDPYSIYKGNPAVKIRERVISL
jgi:putative colanic acid biosynthesis acetyltransferase WcaF